MILTATLVLLAIALIFVVMTGMGKSQLWPAVLCLILLELIRVLPLK